MVELHGVSYQAGSATLLRDVSVSFRPGKFNVIVGPNGAGKSTLMRIASGSAKPSSGTVKYDGEDVLRIAPEALARRRAVLSQNVELAFALTVEEVVLLGRFPHYSAVPTDTDHKIISLALADVGLTEKRLQPYPTLSGGEKQKVQLARVLAQIWPDAARSVHRVLFLDEPVTGLDVHYQLHILDRAKAMLGPDCTVVAVLHDLNLAFEYADTVLILDRGSISLETDKPMSVPIAAVERVFGIRAEWLHTSDGTSHVWRFSRM